jgi:glycerol-3-phosphate dehydrogenase
MAKQTVDRIVERAGRKARCQTAEIPLGMEVDPDALDAPAGVGDQALRQLAFRYGHAAKSVLSIAATDPDLARPIVPGMPDIMAEVVLAAEKEQARSVADVLLRRTRVGLTSASALATADSVMDVSRLLGKSLGWGEDTVRAEAEAWAETARAEGLNPAGLH